MVLSHSRKTCIVSAGAPIVVVLLVTLSHQPQPSNGQPQLVLENLALENIANVATSVLQRDYRQAILKISDAFYYLSLVHQDFYETYSPTLSNFIGHIEQTQEYAQIVSDLLKNSFSKNFLLLLWRMRICLQYMMSQSLYVIMSPTAMLSLRQNKAYEIFWRRQLEVATIREDLEPGFLIDMISDGKGACSTFIHPFHPSYKLTTYASEDGHRLAYLVNRRELDIKVEPELISLAQLSVTCRLLINGEKLNLDELGVLLYHLLQPIVVDDEFGNSFRIPHYFNTLYNPSVAEDSICGRLKALLESNNERHSFAHRFPDPQTQHLFVEACTADLEILLSALLSSNGSDGIYDAYNECVFVRWMNRIGGFVQMQKNGDRSDNEVSDSDASSNDDRIDLEKLKVWLNPSTNSEFARLLKALIDELPVEAAINAYQFGTGICSYLMQDYANTIYDKLEVVMSRDLSFDIDSLDFANLIRFTNLYITCTNLRANIAR